jgi:hypothetical protein
MSSTTVTCYYRIKSKHPVDHYDQWINHFLPNVQCNLIIFTSPDLKDYIQEKRKHLLEKTHIICIELQDLEIAERYKEYWPRQYELDPGKSHGRTIECYILWNSKLWFVKQAIDLNPFQSDKFVWTDIGCLRDETIIHKTTKYPIYEKISLGKIDIVLLQEFQDHTQTFFLDEIHFAGAMFGSDSETMLQFYYLFYAKLDTFIREDKFIGCDQQTISSVYNENRELFNVVRPINEPKTIWIDKWFYLWQYYTN